MKIIGITGNIGSGKSTVEKRLAEILNIPSIDADIVAKHILGHNLEIVSRFSPNCVNQGRIDYDTLFVEIFFNEKKTRAFNREIHTLVEKRIAEIAAEFEQKGFPALILSAALLFEARIKTDFLIVMDCDREIRMKRLAEKLGAKSTAFLRAKALDQRQFSSEAMVYYCDWIINNSREPERTERQVQIIAKKIERKLTKVAVT